MYVIAREFVFRVLTGKPSARSFAEIDPVVAARIEAWARFFRFLAVGGLNTLFGYGLYALFLWIALPPEIALLLATVLGVLFNFVSYGRLAFGGRLTGSTLVRFIGTYVFFFCVNAILLRLLVNSGVSAYAAQLVLMPPLIVCSFLTMRFLVFRARSVT